MKNEEFGISRMQEKDTSHLTLISTKEIMRKYNISYQTINHYTNFGLLDVVTKNGNVRMYDEEDIRKRLETISRLAGEGYPLRLIRKKLVVRITS